MKGKFNINNIKLSTREICKPYQDLKPTDVTDVYWIFAYRKKGKYKEDTINSGKWLIFVSDIDVNEVWLKIKKATEEGKLGNNSKVATAKPSPLAKNPNKKVICVYTYDWTDKEDVMRVRAELRNLGIISKIPYKSDEDTINKKYASTTNERISKYFE